MENRAFEVTAKGGVSYFSVVELVKDPVTGEIKAPVCKKTIMCGAQATDKVVIRVSGGCSNMTDEFRGNAIELVIEDLEPCAGILYSGSTREVQDGKVKMMITDIPGEVARRYGYRCVALGTVPKAFEDFLIKDQSRLSFSANDSLVPATGMERFVVVQEGLEILAANNSTVSGWDADLSVYVAHMEEWENLGFRAAMIAFNGGGVTWKEMIIAAEHGWDLFLMEGSGRKTDEFIAMWREDESFRNQYPDAKVHIVPLAKGALTKALADAGFVKA